jgi:hypothetical protein
MKTTRNYCGGTRVSFDCGTCSSKKGFVQVFTGQDSSYFGTWANPETLKIVTFCEGDVTIQEAETKKEFAEEIRDTKKWNDEMGYSFGIDCALNEKMAHAFESLGLSEFIR